MNVIDELCDSSSIRLIYPILLLIRYVTDRQRMYIWLINLIDDDAYFYGGTSLYNVLDLTKNIHTIKHKYWNQWKILILILTFCDTVFNIKRQIFLLSLSCFHATSKQKSI